MAVLLPLFLSVPQTLLCHQPVLLKYSGIALLAIAHGVNQLCFTGLHGLQLWLSYKFTIHLNS